MCQVSQYIDYRLCLQCSFFWSLYIFVLLGLVNACILFLLLQKFRTKKNDPSQSSIIECIVSVFKKRRQKHNCCSKVFICNRTLLREMGNIAAIYSFTLALALLWVPPHILTPLPLPCPGTCLPRAALLYFYFLHVALCSSFSTQDQPKEPIHMSVS